MNDKPEFPDIEFPETPHEYALPSLDGLYKFTALDGSCLYYRRVTAEDGTASWELATEADWKRAIVDNGGSA